MGTFLQNFAITIPQIGELFTNVQWIYGLRLIHLSPSAVRKKRIKSGERHFVYLARYVILDYYLKKHVGLVEATRSNVGSVKTMFVQLKQQETL